MFSRSKHSRHRSVAALVAAVAGLVPSAALAVAPLAARFSTEVNAAGVSPAATDLAAIEGGAGATASAVRLQPPTPPPSPPANFPMQPTPRCVVLDNFGDPRSGGRTHEGADLMATLGQEVYAMADGVLVYQSKVGDGTNGSALGGNLWKLQAADGTYYIYAHLSAFVPGLVKGQQVYRGQVLGFVGDTGNAGPGNYHLHFEVHPGGGAAVDPLRVLTIPAGCTVY